MASCPGVIDRTWLVSSTQGPTIRWRCHALASNKLCYPCFQSLRGSWCCMHAGLSQPKLMDERAEDARSNKSRRGGQAHLLAQVERGPGWACLAYWQSPRCRWAQTQSNGLQRHPDMPCSQNYRCTLLLMTSCGVSTKHDRGMGYILDLPPPVCDWRRARQTVMLLSQLVHCFTEIPGNRWSTHRQTCSKRT